MTAHVIETVIFRINDGVPKERFLEAARQSNAFVLAQPGFLRRRLSCTDDGSWIEHIEWADITSAKAAAAKIGKAEDARAFVSVIIGSSVTLMHSTLEISVG